MRTKASLSDADRMSSRNMGRNDNWQLDVIVADQDRDRSRAVFSRSQGRASRRCQSPAHFFSSSKQPTGHDAPLEGLPHLARPSTWSRRGTSARRGKPAPICQPQQHPPNQLGRLAAFRHFNAYRNEPHEGDQIHAAEPSATVAIVSTGDGGMQHTGNTSARYKQEQQQSGRFGELAPGNKPGSPALKPSMNSAP